uniref:SET domain-containing protein n=2 Tax=Caenorhabditis japonica TaxID=281687 RepID=A0A8R1DSR2_CAEJA
MSLATKLRRVRKPPPEGWDLIEPTLEQFEAKMREAETEPHEGKRKTEINWPIFRIHHQRSRYVYDMYYKKAEISRELYEFCLTAKFADAALIAKWKKQGYENLCCVKKMVKVRSFRANSNFPQLCDKVKVGWDRKRGRFVEATEDIPIGTVVCVEQGITVNVDPEKCYRCLSSIERTGFAYCNSCEEFYEPDDLACGAFDELGIFKLAAHLVFSYPFAEIANLVQLPDPKVPKCAPTSLSTADLESVFQLTPFPEIGESFKAYQIQEAIAKIVKSLASDKNWGRLEFQNRVVAFTKALRIMAERCAKNAHTIYSIEQKESHFVRNTFIFVSHGVRAGEELVDSYGVTNKQHTLKQRTEFLAQVSGFRCHCDACVEKQNEDEKLEKSFNDVELCAREASCLFDISDYLEYMTPGSKDIENLIVAFVKRADAEIYNEKSFELWKKFVANAKLRGIEYDPYLLRPYLEMTMLAWNDEVECTETEKTSLLVITYRFLKNLYADLHPLSQIVQNLMAFVEKQSEDGIRTTLQKMKIVMRYIWSNRFEEIEGDGGE